MICFIFTSIEMAMICCDNSIEVENTTSRQTASVECQVVSSRTLKCGAASCILSAHKSFQHLHCCHTLSSMYNKNQYRTASCTTDLATCTLHLTALGAASHGHRLSYVIVLYIVTSQATRLTVCEMWPCMSTCSYLPRAFSKCPSS